MTVTGELNDFEWLTSSAAEPWILHATELTAPTVAEVRHLHESIGSVRARLVLELVALRGRAKRKFLEADRLFFTALSLEQSTDADLAAYKARRFVNSPRILDGCCGLGGDLMALATQAEVLGVDRDPLLACLASANLRALGLAGDVKCQDVTDVVPRSCDAWHMDPDRRAQGGRVSRVDLYEPPPETILTWRDRANAGSVKLAPAAQLPEEWRQDAEIEFLETRSECRQQVVWWGRLARHPNRRSATTLFGAQSSTIVEIPDAVTETADEPADYLYVPRKAVLAARLVDSLAQTRRLQRLSAETSYLTAGELHHDASMMSFRVLASLPFDLKRVRKLLRTEGIGHLEVKQQGTGVDANALQRKLSKPEGERAVLLLYKKGRRTLAVLATRLENSTTS